MKKISYSILLLIMTMNFAQSEEIDRSQKPAPLDEIRVEFPYTEIKHLSNGIKVYLIEDERQPSLNIRFLVGGGAFFDNDKPGLSELVAENMTKGTESKSALEIATALDGMGASVSASAGNDFTSIYISTLNKHLDKVLDIASEVILKPSFPDDELGKLKEQFKSGLIAEKSSPKSLAHKLTSILVFGEDHPYSKLTSEDDIDNISRDDLLKYYNRYFIANNVTIAVSGDYKSSNLLSSLEKLFGSWEKGEQIKFEEPKIKSMPKGVYFIERAGSAQSTIFYSFKAPKYSGQDYEYLNFASSIISGGFSGRLFKILREKHSYTYSPYGGIGAFRFGNIFFCGSDVRNDVTDSSIIVIKEQVNDLANNLPSDEEFDAIKKYKYGSYLMSFENTDYVISLIQNAEFRGVRLASLESYHTRIKNMDKRSVGLKAKDYLSENNSYIVVVGNAEVKEKLTQFGQVFEYDVDIAPISGEKAKYTEVSLDADEVLEKYAEAIGSDELDEFKSVVVKSEEKLTIQGRTHKGTTVSKYKDGMHSEASDFGMFTQSKWFDGESSWEELNGNIESSSQKQDLLFKLESNFFGIQSMVKLGFKCEVLGENKGFVVVQAGDEDGNTLYYFDKNSFLLHKSESKRDTPMGMMVVRTEYKDYKKYGNYNLPEIIRLSSPVVNKESKNAYEFNIELSKEDFQGKK